MALSDSEWLDWLENEEKDPVVLVEVSYYDSTEKTLYLSDTGYIDPEDVDANNHLPVIRSEIIIDDQLGSVKFSDLEFENYDDALLDYQFVGFDVEIFYGDRSWPRADFRQQGFTKTRDFTSPSPFKYRLSLLDSGAKFFDQLIKTKNGAIIPIGLPMVLGNPSNVKPLREDTDTFILYTPAVSLTTNFVVRDQGVQLTLTTDYTITYAGEDQASRAGYKYEIDLTSAPTGEITCDPVPSSANDRDLKDIIDAVVGYVTNSITVATSVSDLDGTDLGYVLYDYEDLGQVLEDLCHSIGANPRVNSSGELEVIQIEAPGTATRTVRDENIVGREMSLIRREAPYRELSTGYNKNWTIQTDLASSLSAGAFERYGTEFVDYSWSKYNLSDYPFEQPRIVHTMITDSADGSTEHSRRMTLRGSERRQYQFTGDLSFVYDSLGDTIELFYEHFGFDTGDDVVVIGNRKNLTRQTCQVTVWL